MPSTVIRCIAGISWASFIQAGSAVLLTALTALYVIFTHRLVTYAHWPIVVINYPATDQEDKNASSKNQLGELEVDLTLQNVGNSVALEVSFSVQIEIGQNIRLESYLPLRTVPAVAPKESQKFEIPFAPEDTETIFAELNAEMEAINEKLKKKTGIAKKRRSAIETLAQSDTRMLVKIWYRSNVGMWSRVSYALNIALTPGNPERITAIIAYSSGQGEVKGIRKRTAKREMRGVSECTSD